jgi:ubiquinone/menaquinone biosynthesis C-methylase UbiE
MPWAETNLQLNTERASRFDFDLLANEYDSWYESAKGRMYDRLEKKAISRCLAPGGKGKKLLEDGCGTGHWSRFFSECGFEVTGVDISERMINIARSKGIPNSSFQIANGHSLPFEDNSFDVTAAITTLEIVRDAEAVIREMIRCTRKEAGELLVGTLNVLACSNRDRKQRPESTYANARLFSPSQLRELLEPCGQVSMVITGSVPKQTVLLPVTPLFDGIARRLHIPYGAFIAAEVKLRKSKHK